ncbi:alpha-hydroxy acid oxidase [Variovorax sp. WS11]|uniref:alpha-hydroxy acid oxidase n=1 Tax=Variovorax sp. WS11 TaxID=1105204 RepID=UPI0013DC53DA|nr:alpha-hydroxy acid oxidase [Variovorax sp. WS11]NDZ18339.1 alpha-hydroxy-acid oxidizing protein [Variovorax sp. WS11]
MRLPLAAVGDYRAAARAILPRFAFDYLEGGAEDGRTLARNTLAFQRIDLEPQALVDVAQVDTRASVLGEPLAMPLAVGPTGLNGLYRHRAEEMLAAAAGRAGVPFVLSTASTSAIASVRAATDGPLWLQLYVQNDRRIAQRLMAQARELGFSALLLTVDTPVAGTRDHYRRNGFMLPLRWTPQLLWDVLSHPRWCLQTGRHGMPQMVNLAACADAQPDLDVQAAAMNQQMNMKLTWADLAWVRRHWNGPVLVKGVCSLADARRAHAHGADGVVLSNHGGRQLEDVPSAMELLPEVTDALHGRMALLIDGGVRRGSDIAKAVALGADAVLLGRAPLYGLAVDGERGVDAVLAILRRELEITLRLLGRPRVAALGREALRATWRERLAKL